MDTNVLDALIERADRTPGDVVATYVDDAGRDVASLTAGALLERGRSIAGFLRDRCDLQVGDRAVMVYPPGLEFVSALVGCLFARVIAVPVAPPDPVRPGADVARFDVLARACGARAVLTSSEYNLARKLGWVRGLVKRPAVRWPDLEWHVTDGVSGRAPRWSTPSPDDVAVLQYTSGSTSTPKGVMITHGNLAHQLAINADELGARSSGRAVMWVPHFHDFGLISGILSAVRGNGRLYLLSPLAFIKRPAVWLDVMSRVRATHTAAPNFAYELVLRKTTPEQRRRWDLSSIEVAMSAAEPIQPETVRAFLSAFEASRFRPDAFCPAYGLAEHTVGVSVKGRARVRADRDALEREGVVREGDGDTKELIGCGKPSRDVQLRIVDTERLDVLSDGRVGEIWVDSPSKAAGYWGLEQETRATFRARLPNDSTEYLRTGDLGFVRDGEVYVTGRLKDVIIVRGRNLYPQDIEESVRDCHPLVRPGGIAAFGVEDASRKGAREERIVVVVEAREKALEVKRARELARAVRDRVLEDHAQTCRAVVVLAPGGVAKTTSGKVMRRACRDAFVRGQLEATAIAIETFDEIEVPEPEIAGRPSIAPPPPPIGADRGLSGNGTGPLSLLDGTDEDFRRVVHDLGRAFERMTRARGDRVFHRAATVLRGKCSVVADAPAHDVLTRGASFQVIVRHANGTQDDDAAPDNRGATMRVLDPRSDEPSASMLDLTLTTGECFLAASAEEFLGWMTAGREGRERIAQAHPHIARAAWSMFRDASSFATLHYYAKTASRFIASDGSRSLARFRLVPTELLPPTLASRASVGETDPGRVEPTSLLPPEILPRRKDDARGKQFLHDELRARLAQGTITYTLQIQLRTETGDARVDDEALDCTRGWDGCAWKDFAQLTLDRVEEDPGDLAFDPFNAPKTLAPPRAVSPRDRASLAHARSIVYAIAAAARSGRPNPFAHALAPPIARKRVAVIGAGVSGLSAARALERLGHSVTVFEKAQDVAGKCASIEVDGHAFDLGGHVCTQMYSNVARIAREVGCAIEPATPTLVLDRTGKVRSRGDDPQVREEFARYHGARKSFPAIASPGLAHSANALSAPAATWFAAERMIGLGREIGINYAACGYGRLADDELAALYVVKGAEMAGLLSGGDTSLPKAWTIAGGFGSLWRKVAGALADVRCGVAPRSIERRDGRVLVHLDGSTLEFDSVVMAVSPRHALELLSDASGAERELFGAVRTIDYRTIVARAKGLPEQGFYLVERACEGQGVTVAFHHRYPGSDVVLFYAYGDGLDTRAVEARVAAEVRELGGEIEEVLRHDVWDYFPHVSASDLGRGFFERLERIQGERATYFVGALFGFELVECNVAFAEQLVERRFGGGTRSEMPRRTRPPSRPAVVRDRLLASTDEATRRACLVEYLQRVLVDQLDLSSPPSPAAKFSDIGLDSIAAVEVFQHVVSDTGLAIAPVVFFDHPTIERLAAYLTQEISGDAPRDNTTYAAPYRQTENVVYAERHGVAMMLDVFQPIGTPNGLAVVDVASAAWESTRHAILGHKLYGTYDELCKRGFVVFAVRAGSMTRFDAFDMVESIVDALRWVRSEAKKYGVDERRVGVIGGSAGGHLASLVALRKPASDAANIAALVAFCPPADFRHDRTAPGHDSACTRCRVAIAGRASDAEIDTRLVAISPICAIERPVPTLVFHAERDKAVPFEQAQALVAAIREAGGDAHLEARDSDGHPWPNIYKDMALASEWLEATLTAQEVTAEESDGWIVRAKKLEAPRARLFCFSHSGGLASQYAAWSTLVGDDIEICAFELPGRGAREHERAVTNLDALVDQIEAAIGPLLEVPFSFFGHSLGAAVAFEVTRQLALRGARRPERLFLSACPAPGTLRRESLWGATDLGPALASAPAALRSDVALFSEWARTSGQEPASTLAIDVPITVFGAYGDSIATRPQLEAWRDATRGSFDSAYFAGGHFYFVDDAAPLTQEIATRLAARRDPQPAQLELGSNAFASWVDDWCERPSALTGSSNAFDLVLLARCCEPDGTPSFPSALALTLAHAREWSTISPHPYCNFVVALAAANTLARHRGQPAADETTRELLRIALREHVRLAEPRFASGEGPYAARFRFAGMAGRWLVPSRESAALLKRAPDLVDEAAHSVLASYAAADAPDPTTSSMCDAFDRDSTALHFAEYFPDTSITSDAARAHVGRSMTRAGLTAAFGARYYELTRDRDTKAALLRQLERPLDGLRPTGAGQEREFILYYLARGGVDLRRVCPRAVEAFVSGLDPNGTPIDLGAAAVDCDATAITNVVCAALGITPRLATTRLDAWWNEQKGAYQSADGRDSYTVSTLLHVLDAYLDDPDVAESERARIAARAIDALESRPWIELHHLSPFFIWSNIVTSFFAHERSFEHTRVHHEALALILGAQDVVSGGFASAFTERPNLEESALALLALEHAREGTLDDAERAAVAAAIDAARPFVANALRDPGPLPALWTGKLLYAPEHIIRAIANAALARHRG